MTNNYYSKNKKLNGVLNEIHDQLEQLGYNEIKRYRSEFYREVDYAIAEYGNVLCYYSDIRAMYERNGYTSILKYSDTALWNIYKRQVGYMARQYMKEVERR